MKIYTKIVIDIDSNNTLYEEYYDYNGAIAECKSGGAGGGSPSGTVDYPAYMKTAHGEWLDGGGADHVIYSVTDLMNAAMSGPSPYANFETIDVNGAFLGPYKTPSDYIGPYDMLSDFRCFDVESIYNTYIEDEKQIIDNYLTAESDFLDDEINIKVLPRFKQGMDDINAVQSDAFVIGTALIWNDKVRTLSKTNSAVILDMAKSQADIAIRRVGLYIEWGRLTTSLATEIARIYTASKHEVDALKAEMNARDRLFDLTIYQYGTNVMSSISGSAVSPPDPGPARTGIGAALSGALAGAAMGAMIPGAGVTGAVIGGALGFAGALL